MGSALQWLAAKRNLVGMKHKRFKNVIPDPIQGLLYKWMNHLILSRASMGGKAAKAWSFAEFWELKNGGGSGCALVKWPPVWRPCLPKIYHGGPVVNVHKEVSFGNCAAYNGPGNWTWVASISNVTHHPWTFNFMLTLPSKLTINCSQKSP